MQSVDLCSSNSCSLKCGHSYKKVKHKLELEGEYNMLQKGVGLLYVTVYDYTLPHIESTRTFAISGIVRFGHNAGCERIMRREGKIERRSPG